MSSILETYFADVDKAIVRMRDYPSKEIVLLHHNDTDGLTSGSVLYKAFCDEGYKVQRFSLEKPYPKVLEKLFAENSGKLKSPPFRIIITCRKRLKNQFVYTFNMYLTFPLWILPNLNGVRDICHF